MGNNYYVRVDEKEIHLGKSSIGHRFCFSTIPELGLNTAKDWKTYLEKNKYPIFDEYGKEEKLDDLWDFIEKKQNYSYTPASSYGIPYDSLDAEGYRMWRDANFS